MGIWYARFKIPSMEDGKVVTYSPGWCGTRDKCALNEKGTLYHDKERWGIMQAEGDFVPDDVEVLTKEEVIKLVKEKEWIGIQLDDGTPIDMELSNLDVTIKDGAIVFTTNGEPKSIDLGESVFCGQKLVDRYLPQAEVSNANPDATGEEIKPVEQPDVVSVSYVSCPICHRVVYILKRYTDRSMSLFSLDTGKVFIQGIIAKSLNTTCPVGHKISIGGQG